MPRIRQVHGLHGLAFLGLERLRCRSPVCSLDEPERDCRLLPTFPRATFLSAILRGSTATNPRSSRGNRRRSPPKPPPCWPTSKVPRRIAYQLNRAETALTTKE